MLATCQYTLFSLVCCSLLRTVFTITVFPQNGTNSSNPSDGQANDFITQALNEKLTTWDYYFFSYDIIDHITLLIKFDLTKTSLLRENETVYRAYLYVSKLPSTDYKIDIGPFTGYYEKELHGSIMDHFTFCLVLTPNRRQNLTKIITSRNQTETIQTKFLRRSARKQQQQYIIHYCTKMGPDEDRHRHHLKQGSGGDHVLLVLQLMMIALILTILQVVHAFRNRKKRKWHLRRLNRIRRELMHRKEYIDMPSETLAMLRFIPIVDPTSHEEIADPERDDEEGGEEQDEEDSIILSHRRLLTRPLKYQRSRSSSPNGNRNPVTVDASLVEHILQAKPWLQTPH